MSRVLIYPECSSPGVEQEPGRVGSRKGYDCDRGRRDGYRVVGTVTEKESRGVSEEAKHDHRPAGPIPTLQGE